MNTLNAIAYEFFKYLARDAHERNPFTAAVDEVVGVLFIEFEWRAVQFIHFWDP
jgi:hypothetical protein